MIGNASWKRQNLFASRLNESSGRKRILLILTAKYAGFEDSLADYMEHLDKDPDGEGPSRIKTRPHLIKLGKLQWVDATLEGFGGAKLHHSLFSNHSGQYRYFIHCVYA